MAEQQEICDIARETIYVLSNFEPAFVAKISKRVLNDLKQLAYKSNKIVSIDKTKSLNEQNIMPETRDMIAVLYYNYIASTEEKKIIVQKWNENEVRFQEKLKRKYNLDNLLKKDEVSRERHVQKTDEEEKYSGMLNYVGDYDDENIFQRIINKIKDFFNK